MLHQEINEGTKAETVETTDLLDSGLKNVPVSLVDLHPNIDCGSPLLQAVFWMLECVENEKWKPFSFF
jgi:hypothetical protein